MKRFFIAFFIIVNFAFPGNAQVINDTIYFDEYWEQCLPDSAIYYRVITNDTTGKFQFNVTDFYMSGQLQMTGTYRSIQPDYKTDLFTYWYENGRKQIECMFKNNKLTGEYKEWYATGQIKTIRSYKNGYLNGKETVWEENGILSKIAEYKNGLKQGRFITYYDNGMPIRKDFYKNDSLIKGKCFTYSGKDTSYFNYIIFPEFNGAGIEKFKEFVLNELNYPETAKQNKENGKVYVRFTIDKTGKVTEVAITKKDKNYFNQEAMRVVKSSPYWIPGKRDGKVIEFLFTIPILFEIQ